ncbi:YcxB family protein [Micropruina sp.]|uniref:YcxB family protein n=1 Tax=Micropruina sp. TaxID=2737536 RepID=UPI0039E38201
MSSRVHVLTPPLPLRAFGVAALLAVAGAALTVTSSAARLPTVLTVMGWILLAGAVALCVVAANSWRRMRVRVELSDDGYVIDGPDAHEQGRWADVTKVTQTPTTLVIHHGPEHRVRLVSRRGVTAELIHLTGDLARRLDANRGYSTQL